MLTIRRRSAALVATVTAALTLPLVGGPPGALASEPVGHTDVVPEQPRTDTPRLFGGQINDMLQWGDRILLGGSFDSVQDNDGTTFQQPSLVAYDIDTGAIDRSFRPAIDREVQDMELSPDGSSLYIVGSFNTVNGVSRRKVARIFADGSTDTSFSADANSRVSAIAVADDRVYVGGFFSTIRNVERGRLAALDPATGAVDPDFDIPVTEGLGRGALLKVHDLLLTPADDKLVVVHSGNRVGGLVRTGVAIIDTAADAVSDWQSTLYTDNLDRVGGVLRVNAGDISPDGSYIVLVSGSGGDRPPVNDTAVALPTDGGAGVEPLWVSRHFDSLFGVAITEAAVYIGGHFRWQEAPGSTEPWPGDSDSNYGWDAGEGAYALGDEVVRRDQIGALDPATGKALAWDPGSNAVVGVQTLVPVERGLLLFHDGTLINGQNLGRHVFFDYEDVAEPFGTPTSEIETPFPGVTLDADPFTFSGTAFAPDGVDRVQLEIQINGAGQFLQDDGTVGPGWNGIDATLADPGAIVTSWSADLAIPQSGAYVVRSKVFSSGADELTKDEVKFEVDANPDGPPETEITWPTWRDPAPESTTFTMTGTAADDIGVASVRLVFQERDTDEYLQDDFSAGPGYNAFAAVVESPGEPVTNWSFEVTLPYGTWTVQANATDTSGQIDNGFVRTRITLTEDGVTNEAPSVVVTAPETSLDPAAPTVVDANQPVTFEGTATDVEGTVEEIEIRIANDQTTQGVAANGTWGVPGYARATLSGPDADGVYSWSFTSPPLQPGSYSVAARGYDDQGSRSRSARAAFVAQVPGDQPPATVFDQASETPDQDIESLDLHLTGSATDDLGVTDVVVTIQESYSLEFFQARRYVTPDGDLASNYTTLPATLSGPATDRTWSLDVTLPQEGDYTITAKAVDTAGQHDIDQSDAYTRWIIWPGDADPRSVIQGPATGSEYPVGPVILAGRAFDDGTFPCQAGFTCGIEALDISIRNGNGQYLDTRGNLTDEESWHEGFLTNPGGEGSNFNFTTPDLTDGVWTIRARAMDLRYQVDQVADADDTITVIIGTGIDPDPDPEPVAPTADISADCTDLACTFDGSGSTDDGSITSWAWDLGDGTTATTATVEHTYATAGTYTVTLTVTDDQGLTDTTSTPVTVSEVVEVAPTADISADCTDLGCTFDGSGSTDDGSITSWAWDLGDGTTATTATVEHTYATAGTYTVTLTVTDDQGLTDTTSAPVTVTAPVVDDVAFVGADHYNGGGTLRSVQIAADVEAGDTLLLFATINRSGVAFGPGAGWTLVENVTDGSMATGVWSRTAEAGDAGTTVPVTVGQWSKMDLALAAYRGGSVAASASAGEPAVTAAHTTPAVAAADGSWAVSYWADKTSATTSWTAPAGERVRATGAGSGGGRISALLTDRGPVAAGPAGGLTATADSANGKATMVTIVIAAD